MQRWAAVKPFTTTAQQLQNGLGANRREPTVSALAAGARLLSHDYNTRPAQKLRACGRGVARAVNKRQVGGNIFTTGLRILESTEEVGSVR